MNYDSLQSDTISAANSIRRNIDAVARLEEEFIKNRSVSDRIADGIGGFTGSLKFVGIHVMFLGSWILINLGAVPFIRKFDPFPFLLMGMMVSVEAIFLSTFVLMKQNRMSKREDLRAHLDLQINLLAEQEMTLVLQMLYKIAERLEVRVDPGNLQGLAQETSVQDLADQLRESLPEE